MKKLSQYKMIKNIIDLFYKSEKENKDSVELMRQIDPVYGFQLNRSDLSDYLRGYLSQEQANIMLKNINLTGYLDYEIGMFLKEIIEDQNFDIYIKSVHDSQIESIFSEGIRCYGTSSSISTINPDTIREVNLDNTIEKIWELTVLISRIKNNNGLSHGFNEINGTLILRIPKNTTKEEILYFNEEYGTFNIKPSYIIGFLPVDEKKVVKGGILPQVKEDHIANHKK